MKRTLLLSLLFVFTVQSEIFSQCSGSTVYACYGNNYNQTVIAQICPDAGFKNLDIDFMSGMVETGQDLLSIYSGAMGSGTTGTPVAIYLQGNLTGLSYTNAADQECLILVAISNGNTSCDDSKSFGNIEICARSSQALPVELISFEASLTKTAEQVLLNWKTASELANKGFEIQKSSDARSWEAIKWIQGNGTTNLENSYQYVDQFPYDNISYYRLKQMDMDGRFEYSEVRSVRNIKAAMSVSLFPNPAQEMVNITIDNPGEQPLKVSLFDNLGSKIWEEQVANGSRLYEKQLNIEQNGVYFLATETAGKVQFEKIVINK